MDHHEKGKQWDVEMEDEEEAKIVKQFDGWMITQIKSHLSYVFSLVIVGSMDEFIGEYWEENWECCSMRRW